MTRSGGWPRGRREGIYAYMYREREKERERERASEIDTADSLHCAADTSTTLYSNYTPIKIIN